MGDQTEETRKKKIKEAYREATTDFTTESGIIVNNVYTPEDISDIDFDRDIGFPGQYPFTRGHHPLMYRGKLWNIREISGLSTPAKFNERCKFLVEQGAGALDWELDGPTLYGIEPDQPMAEGQLGVCGVALHTLRDVEVLSEGLPLDELSLSSDAFYPDVWQSYILTAKKKGYDISKLRGIGGAIFYYGPSVFPSRMDWLVNKGDFSTLARWGNDFCEYAYKNFPRWNIWFTSSYDLQEAGGNAIQEIAFTIAIRNELIREMLRRGLDINTIGNRLSPVLGINRDFFEEVAKLRAARRIWARTMKEEFKATDPKAMCLRFHVDVSGANFTRQQPLVNIARGTLGTLAAVFGGSMGIQTPSFDEGWATPTEEAVRLAIRTQQVIRYESGITRVADPLAGSYYVEWLTSELEEKIEAMVHQIEEMGGWLTVLDSGWVHEQLKEGLLDIQRKVENGQRTVIGVNRFQIPPEDDFRPNVFAPDTSDVEKYLKDYVSFKKKRDHKTLKEKIKNLQNAANDPDKNLVSYVYDALEADATFPEIIGVMRMNDGLEYDWAGERDFPF
ncbi:MAG: methylmalonyl-CoA mutase family protein [Thermodesulfobacteriota bacterium]|nr:methylmalonyl-CoA mutase family protein [Thermodesulfobacteriota bacterium]